VTVTGTNFISGYACTAKVGATPSTGTAAACSYASATTVTVVIGGATATGASSVELTFTNGNEVATVTGTPLTIVGSGASISLSNHVMGITPVVMTVSFTVSAAAFKLISITGLRFAALNASTASVLCSNLAAPHKRLCLLLSCRPPGCCC